VAVPRQGSTTTSRPPGTSTGAPSAPSRSDAHEHRVGHPGHAGCRPVPRGDPHAEAGSLPPLIRLLTNDIPADITGPGSWMHEALELRDQWRSKLLRAAVWSPLP
jgi:hypothetical protein